MNLLELTRKLISIPSISGEEHAVAAFLAAHLKELGFEVETQEVVEGRRNVYARIGDPDVTLSTHIDTVPPYVELREDNEYIYGRGACDTKGIIASMIEAARSLKNAGVTDFGVLLLIGEEAGSVGARAANGIPNRCQYLINGEPTESKLAVGSKGALRGFIRTKGRAAHSAYPELGESAINKLIDVLFDLRRADFPDDPNLGRTTTNIGMISGGVAANVIAPEAHAEFMFRVVTRADSLKREIEAVIGQRAEIEYTFACDPVFMETLDGFETAVVSFTTDIPMLTNWGRPLLYGPGSILDAHTAGERVSKSDLSRAVESYVNMVRTLKERLANE
jgi:acetylornithine deacetylase